MNTLIEAHRSELEQLCQRYHVKRLELFGSVATEEFKPETSDIDFLVEFAPDHEMGPWLAEYFDLKDELERLFGHKVDLVMIGALRNPYFIEQVNRSRTLLYAA